MHVTAGPDSWLVRPSDTTEGDFSIFFFCNTAVQRFKIQKSGHQYSMGGRYFDRSVYICFDAVEVDCKMLSLCCLTVERVLIG